MLLFQARIDLGAMLIKGFSTLRKALLEPHHQIVYCYTQDTLLGSLIPLQRSSQCILKPQMTGLFIVLFCAIITRDSVSPSTYFINYVQIVFGKYSSVSRLKYPYSCFSSHFYFIVFVIILFGFMLSLLLHATMISLSLLFLV